MKANSAHVSLLSILQSDNDQDFENNKQWHDRRLFKSKLKSFGLRESASNNMATHIFL